jgi:GT2 family glycosyltransferase
VSAPVSAVIVSYQAREHLLRALASLASAGLPIETIVVDNASADGSADAVRHAFPEVRVLANTENLGFARAANQGIRQARAPRLLLLNPDAELRPGALEALAGALDARPEVVAVGPRTLNADGTVQVSFGPELTLWNEWRQRRLVLGVAARSVAALARAAALAAREHEPAWLSGSCLLLRREAALAVGLFDEDFFLYEEDVDLCLRLRRAGGRILFLPAAEVVHQLGRSMATAPWRARLEYQRSHLRFYRKHRGAAERALIRILILLRSGAALRSSRAPGGPPRGFARDLLRLALRGR